MTEDASSSKVHTPSPRNPSVDRSQPSPWTKSFKAEAIFVRGVFCFVFEFVCIAPRQVTDLIFYQETVSSLDEALSGSLDRGRRPPGSCEALGLFLGR